MAKLFDLNYSREYVLKCDIGLPVIEQSKFVLGRLDSQLLAYIDDKVTSWSYSGVGNDNPAQVTINLKQKNWLLVQFGVKSWINLKDDNGNEYKPEYEDILLPIGRRRGLSVKSMDLISPYIEELAQEIIKDNYWNGDKEKNF